MSGPTPSMSDRLVPPQDDSARKQMMRESGRALRHIGEARLMAVIAAAVRHAVKRTFRAVEEDQLVQAAGIAQRGFLHLMKNNGRSVRGLPVSDFVKEVEESRKRILRQREQARMELDRVTSELEERKVEMREERAQILRTSEAAGAKMDSALVDQLDVLFADLGDTPEVARLREAVTQIALSSVHTERDKGVQEKLSDHDAEVANYQRRIQKLTESLSKTEEEIKRLAQMKDVDHGVASIYRTVQGLSDGEDAEQKQEMMTAIFEANLEFREKLAG